MAKNYELTCDVCVIGAGHAGCEAALASARLGLETVVFTMNTDAIAMMNCNPHIGGSSKGHIVREIDALGGQMGKNIDQTFLQSKMLNRSKGPAVHSLRAQADKAAYARRMRQTLENQPHLTIRQGEVVDILTDEDKNGTSGQRKITGVVVNTGTIYHCRAVIICTGTYLNARCLVGECITETGPSGMQRSTYLRDALAKLGITTRRFKTGTPARMDGRTLDYSKMKRQDGDPVIEPFSFSAIVHSEMSTDTTRNKLIIDSEDDMRKSHMTWSNVLFEKSAKACISLFSNLTVGSDCAMTSLAVTALYCVGLRSGA